MLCCEMVNGYVLRTGTTRSLCLFVELLPVACCFYFQFAFAFLVLLLFPLRNRTDIINVYRYSQNNINKDNRNSTQQQNEPNNQPNLT